MFAEMDNTNWYCQRRHWELRTQSPQNLNKIGQKGCVLVHISILPHSRIIKKKKADINLPSLMNSQPASVQAARKSTTCCSTHAQRLLSVVCLII